MSLTEACLHGMVAEAVRIAGEDVEPTYRNVVIAASNMIYPRYGDKSPEFEQAWRFFHGEGLWRYLAGEGSGMGVELQSQWFDGRIRLDRTSSAWVYRECLGSALNSLPTIKDMVMAAAEPTTPGRRYGRKPEAKRIPLPGSFTFARANAFAWGRSRARSLAACGRPNAGGS